MVLSCPFRELRNTVLTDSILAAGIKLKSEVGAFDLERMTGPHLKAKSHKRKKVARTLLSEPSIDYALSLSTLTSTLTGCVAFLTSTYLLPSKKV